MQSCKKVFGAHYAPLFFNNAYNDLTVIVNSLYYKCAKPG